MHHRLLVSAQVITELGILLKSFTDAGDVTVTKDSETASKELVLGPISLDMLLL
jgi:hypothetical protein